VIAFDGIIFSHAESDGCCLDRGQKKKKNKTKQNKKKTGTCLHIQPNSFAHPIPEHFPQQARIPYEEEEMNLIAAF
jgi:hypothetical protein